MGERVRGGGGGEGGWGGGVGVATHHWRETKWDVGREGKTERPNAMYGFVPLLIVAYIM